MWPSSRALVWPAGYLGLSLLRGVVGRGIEGFLPVFFQFPQTELLVGARQGDGHLCFYFTDRQTEGRDRCLTEPHGPVCRLGPINYALPL